MQVGTRGWGIVFVEAGGSGYFGIQRVARSLFLALSTEITESPNPSEGPSVGPRPLPHPPIQNAPVPDEAPQRKPRISSAKSYAGQSAASRYTGIFSLPAKLTCSPAPTGPKVKKVTPTNRQLVTLGYHRVYRSNLSPSSPPTMSMSSW